MSRQYVGPSFLLLAFALAHCATTEPRPAIDPSTAALPASATPKSTSQSCGDAVCIDTRFCQIKHGCSGAGSCEVKPDVRDCPSDCPGACGCNGAFFCNPCLAHAAGVSVDSVDVQAVPKLRACVKLQDVKVSVVPAGTPSPIACPATLAEGKVGDHDALCRDRFTQCNYEHGQCYCEESCGPGPHEPKRWTCHERAPECPIRPAKTGTPCSNEGLRCEWGAFCEKDLDLCQGGAWHLSGPSYP